MVHPKGSLAREVEAGQQLNCILQPYSDLSLCNPAIQGGTGEVAKEYKFQEGLVTGPCYTASKFSVT
jgi:hypothetical protein